MKSSAVPFLLWLGLALVACGGDGLVDETPDAGEDGADGGAEVCAGVVYDSCADTTGSTDCMDGLQCHNYMAAGLTVCVPTCDVNNPCPDQASAPIRCNMMGRCRPDVANECALP